MKLFNWTGENSLLYIRYLYIEFPLHYKAINAPPPPPGHMKLKIGQ